MAEIDPVILELRAEMNRYRAELQSSTALVDSQLGKQQRSVQQLERQFQQSSGAIGNTLKSLAGTIAAAFSVREIVRMGDTWSDLQSQVGVAVKDMEAAPELMGRIAEAARASYSPLEQTATQFARNARTLEQMGYSTEHALQFTEALNNALVATATRGDRARQVQDSLSKAIATGKLEAEGLENILAHGGAVAESLAQHLGVTTNELYRLRKEGKLTGDVIVRSLINNFDQLRAQAETMPATVSDGFTLLRNELMRYIGETDQALGATERMAQALIMLSENIDVVAKGLAIVAAFIGSKYVLAAGAAAKANVALAASATGSAASMGAMGAAAFALQARLAGAATTTEALTFAMRGLTAAVPILAVTSLIVTLGYYVATAESAADRTKRLAETADEAEAKADDMARRLREAGVAAETLGNAGRAGAKGVDALSRSMETAIRRAKELEDQAGLTTIRLLQSQIEQAQAERMQAERSFEATRGLYHPKAQEKRRADLDALGRTEQALRRQLQLYTEGLRRGVKLDNEPPGLPTPRPPEVKPEKPKTPKTPRGRTGPSPEEIERRYLDELDSLRSQIAAAEASMARSVDERAELELRQLEAARRQTLRSLEADEDYNQAQKARVRGAIEAAAAAEREAIEFNRRAQLEREATELADEHYRAQDEQLRLQYDLARTEAERRAIAMQILDAEDAYLKAKLEAVIASETATEAEQERARIALASLEATAGSRRAVAERQHQGALGRYLDSTADPHALAEEAAARELQNVRDGLAEGLAEQFGMKNDFVKDMLAIFLDEVLFRPIAEALRTNSGGGIGGILGSVVGSIFGRASGGYVGPGQMVRVNEHKPGVELLRMGSQGGTVIPLGNVNAAASKQAPQGGGVSVVRLELSGDIDARIQNQAAGVAVQVVRASAPELIDASANETIGRLTRPTM